MLHSIIKMAFIKEESEDIKMAFIKEQSEDIKMAFIKEESEDFKIEETFSVKQEETEEQTEKLVNCSHPIPCSTRVSTQTDSSKRPLLAPTVKVGRKRKSIEERAEIKKKCEERRTQSRINIGSTIARWRKLQRNLGLKTDADMADFLLSSYERGPVSSTPMKTGFKAPLAPAASTIFSSDTDRGGEFTDEDIHDQALINLQGTSDIQMVESRVPTGP